MGFVTSLLSGLKNLALLCMLPEGESLSESDTVSVSPPTDGAPESHTADKAGKGKDEKPSTGSFMHSNVSTHYAQNP